MNQEQMERAINFVVQHHAQFAADIQQLKETQVVTEQQLQQLMKTQAEAQARQAEAQAGNEARFAQMIKAQAEGQAANDKRFSQVGEAFMALITLTGRAAKDQMRGEETQRQTSEELAEAKERWRVSINETNECLRGLIQVVERYIHSQNGNGESHGD